MTIAISNEFLRAFSNVQKGQQKQVREFIEQFRERPDAPGINYEPIKSSPGLFSVRINQAYRAIVFRPPGSEVYVLTWVDHHDDAYRWAERKQLHINPATGALQVISTVDVPVSAPAERAETAPKIRGLFASVKDKDLLRLGVPEQLLSLVRTIALDSDLEKAEEQLPQEAYEGLFMLASGYSLQEVLLEMEKPEAVPVVDTSDFETALENEDSKRRFYVVDEAAEMSEILNAPLEQWRIFLHPKQRRLVEMRASGPVRVLGGAGTGKTVVAMHRARYLVEKVFTRPEDRILFTTFTRNLATDIFESLYKLCSADGLKRIDVENLDGWVSRFLQSQGYRNEAVFDEEGNEAWANALTVAPAELGLPETFYRAEWEQVIQAQNLTDADSYMHAPRLGRGTRLSRPAKKKIWNVFQEYRAQLNEQGKKEFVDLLRDARGLIETKKIRLPYRAVVLDEAQDMSSEAFRLIRAIVPPGENDLFIVGDAHQRIYRYRTSLGQCGIDIRGRGKKLKINYRTTDETRRFAVRLLEGRPIDDLNGGIDDQKGYVSLTHGQPPLVKQFKTFQEEITFLLEHLKRLANGGTPLSSVCVVARTKRVLDGYTRALKENGFEIYEIKRNTPEQTNKPGIRLATMHRVKGLEFEHIVIVSANDGIIPLDKAVREPEDDVAARNAETGERSLLYVAITRARMSAAITCNGRPSPFLA